MKDTISGGNPAGRAGGVARPVPRNGRNAGASNPLVGTSTPLRPIAAMTPAPWGWRWRTVRRRADWYRLCRGNLARPGREQPNPGRQRSRVTGVRFGYGGPGGDAGIHQRGPRGCRQVISSLFFTP